MICYCKGVKINLDHDIPRISLIDQDHNNGCYEVSIHGSYCIIIELENDRLVFASSHFVIVNDGERL